MNNWFFAISIAGAVATGIAADRKGYDNGPWFLFGLLLWIVALPVILLKPNKAKNRRCPMCTTWISRGATVCGQCGRDVTPEPSL